MTTPKIDTQKRSFFQDRKMWFWIAAGGGLLTLIVLVIFLQSLSSTTKYYVLKSDVPARTLITTDMLQEQVVSTGGEPPTAIDAGFFQTGEFYSKALLNAGDILTESNVGGLIPLTQGIPDDFVVTSFSADPNTSAGGNVKRGDYIDIFYVGNGEASLLFQRVLILDTTTDLNAGDGAAEGEEGGAVVATEGTATATYRGGVPFLYTVGLTQADALKLSAASEGKFYVVLSSANDVKNGASEKTLGMSVNDALSAPAGDSGKGTDNLFGESKKADNADQKSSPSASSAPASQTPAPVETDITVDAGDESPEVQLDGENN